MSDASASPDRGDEGAADRAAQDATTSSDDTGSAVDWQAEAQKWREQSRKHEADYKKSVSALKRLETASMTEQERVVAEAEAKGRASAMSTVAERLVDAEVRAAAAGRDLDTTALLEGLDRSRFLGDDGEPDREAIEAFLDRLAPKQAKRLDLGQGAREGAPNADMNAILRRAAGR